MFNNKTQLNLVIGYPLEHTLSPLLHNSVYPLLNLNAVMLAHASHDLSATIQALKTFSVGYAAVTMPFKEAILPYLDKMNDEVNTLKAANTIIAESGQLIGYNTDIYGIEYALRHTALSNKNILLIGCGGAGHAAAYYLKKQNAHLFYVNRTVKNALALTELFGGTIIDINDLQKENIDVIINATPQGMFPNIKDSPLPHYHFKQNQTVFDMVYNPHDTVLIKNATMAGAHCISGLDMFLAQGLKQIELWSQQIIDMEKLIPSLKIQLKDYLIK